MASSHHEDRGYGSVANLSVFSDPGPEDLSSVLEAYLIHTHGLPPARPRMAPRLRSQGGKWISRVIYFRSLWLVEMNDHRIGAISWPRLGNEMWRSLAATLPLNSVFGNKKMFS